MMNRAMWARVKTVPVRSLLVWLVEVEQDRQVARACAIPLGGLENCFRSGVKRPRIKHRLFTDGVDDVADLLVVEQQIDELRDLDVVDGDLRPEICWMIKSFCVASASFRSHVDTP